MVACWRLETGGWKKYAGIKWVGTAGDFGGWQLSRSSDAGLKPTATKAGASVLLASQKWGNGLQYVARSCVPSERFRGVVVYLSCARLPFLIWSGLSRLGSLPETFPRTGPY